jgi:hypothetical protein
MYEYEYDDDRQRELDVDCPCGEGVVTLRVREDRTVHSPVFQACRNVAGIPGCREHYANGDYADLIAAAIRYADNRETANAEAAYERQFHGEGGGGADSSPSYRTAMQQSGRGGQIR